MRAQSVYQAELQPIAGDVEAFFAQAFETDGGSMFTPGVPIWTSANLNELKQRFIDQPDESTATFEVKLRKQLEGGNRPRHSADGGDGVRLPLGGGPLVQ